MSSFPSGEGNKTCGLSPACFGAHLLSFPRHSRPTALHALTYPVLSHLHAFACPLPCTRNVTPIFQDSAQVPSSPPGLVSSLEFFHLPLRIIHPLQFFWASFFKLWCHLKLFGITLACFPFYLYQRGWRVSQKVKSWHYLSSWITTIGSLASLSSFIKGRIVIALASEQIFNVFPIVMWLPDEFVQKGHVAFLGLSTELVKSDAPELPFPSAVPTSDVPETKRDCSQ